MRCFFNKQVFYCFLLHRHGVIFVSSYIKRVLMRGTCLIYRRRVTLKITFYIILNLFNHRNSCKNEQIHQSER